MHLDPGLNRLLVHRTPPHVDRGNAGGGGGGGEGKYPYTNGFDTRGSGGGFKTPHAAAAKALAAMGYGSRCVPVRVGPMMFRKKSDAGPERGGSTMVDPQIILFGLVCALGFRAAMTVRVVGYKSYSVDPVLDATGFKGCFQLVKISFE